MWPHDFHLTYSVILTSTNLTTTLTIKNSDVHPFECNALFHTYFSVNDIRVVGIKGLQGRYFEDGKAIIIPKKGIDECAVVEFEVEVDRMYPNVAMDAPVAIEQGGSEIFQIKREGARDIGMTRH
jgi:D-hexose-6-phosphate mutarotase